MGADPRSGLDDLSDRYDRLLGEAGGFFAARPNVLLVLSSSRGGSSIFAEMLRRRHDLLHLRAEINPFFVLAGRGFPESGQASDRLTAADVPAPGSETFRRLDRALSADCGWPAERLEGDAEKERFAGELEGRLTLQWTEEHFEHGFIRALVETTLRTLQREEGWEPGAFPDAQAFFVRFLLALRKVHPVVHPGAYDLDRALLGRHAPELPPAPPPPGLVLVEEPPFVLPVPWRRATAAELATTPIVVKTPSNAYRLPFLRRLFPSLQAIHLTRNAAASCNGLYDGWRFPGFHSHRLSRPLSIAGYTDSRPEDAHWWKFDLPPGWEAFRSAPLPMVTALQWSSAHRHILEWRAENLDIPWLTLRFEDVLAGRLGGLHAWLGAPGPDLSALPPVMATAPPRQRRWFDRADLLAPALRTEGVREMMGALGYGERVEEWV